MSTQAHIETLDAKYSRWDLWRTALKAWCVKIDGEVISGDTIEEALAKAAEFKQLPKIPRCPSVLWREKFAAVKSGSKWNLTYQGNVWFGNIATKKAAESAADGFVERANKAFEDWRASFGRISMGVEGVDFRYAE